MKWYQVIAFALVFITLGKTQAQSTKSAFIEPFKLEVTFNKTTILVFPAAIISVDKGSADIAVQKANGVENILRVKADQKDFEETNLSVITGNGQFYSFVVTYSSNPAHLNIDVKELPVLNGIRPGPSQSLRNNLENLTESDLPGYAEKAAKARRNIHALYDEGNKMLLELSGTYIKNNVLFFRLAIQNRSRIDYDIDQFKLYLRDKKIGKRTAFQEIEIIPLYVSGDTAQVKGKSSQILIVAVPKFTIPEKKNFIIEIMEKNGGRQLNLRAVNRHIMKARKLTN